MIRIIRIPAKIEISLTQIIHNVCLINLFNDYILDTHTIRIQYALDTHTIRLKANLMRF